MNSRIRIPFYLFFLNLCCCSLATLAPQQQNKRKVKKKWHEHDKSPGEDDTSVFAGFLCWKSSQNNWVIPFLQFSVLWLVVQNHFFVAYMGVILLLN